MKPLKTERKKRTNTQSEGGMCFLQRILEARKHIPCMGLGGGQWKAYPLRGIGSVRYLVYNQI